jgi:hypothetical protein
MHGGIIFSLRGELPFDRLYRHLRDRLDTSPRFRQRLVFPPTTSPIRLSRKIPTSISTITRSTGN